MTAGIQHDRPNGEKTVAPQNNYPATSSFVPYVRPHPASPSVFDYLSTDLSYSSAPDRDPGPNQGPIANVTENSVELGTNTLD